MNTAKAGGLVELLPCPFCGRQEHRTFIGEQDIQFFHCDERAGGCGAVVSFSPRKIGLAAFNAWNTRALTAHGQPVVDKAMLRRAMNAQYNGIFMRDALMMGTDWDAEVLEAALTAALTGDKE